jgi:hypothetical protein
VLLKDMVKDEDEATPFQGNQGFEHTLAEA